MSKNCQCGFNCLSFNDFPERHIQDYCVSYNGMPPAAFVGKTLTFKYTPESNCDWRWTRCDDCVKNCGVRTNNCNCRSTTGEFVK